jgi:hypothetical protein
MSRQYESSSDAGTNNNAATSGFFLRARSAVAIQDLEVSRMLRRKEGSYNGYVRQAIGNMRSKNYGITDLHRGSPLKHQSTV